MDQTSPRRRYDSPVRRQRAAETRERIVAAGADLAHRVPTWDWAQLTMRAVAERAGVSESTAYRHFANERELHDAVMHRLQEQAGVVYEGIALDEVGDVAARVFTSMSSFAAALPGLAVEDPAISSEDRHRRDALAVAVADAAPGWTDEQRRAVAGLLDVLWSPLAFERLVAQWGLTPQRATEAIRWIIAMVTTSVDDGTAPLQRRRRTSTG
ncbi:MAG TPA: helix-turn-helix domain-containing protein [Mycobacteriales bacterium]|nr:helix-turn-helix domain-containing protein [Mycobacteriales bacterium]